MYLIPMLQIPEIFHLGRTILQQIETDEVKVRAQISQINIVHALNVISKDCSMTTIQKQPPEVFSEKRCSQKFCRIHRKTPVPESLFLKKRPWHSRFPVNFEKFLRTYFLQNTSVRLLLNNTMYLQSAPDAPHPAIWHPLKIFPTCVQQSIGIVLGDQIQTTMNQSIKEKKQQSTISTSKYGKKLYVSIYKSSSKGRASQETNKQTHKKDNKQKQTKIYTRFTFI